MPTPNSFGALVALALRLCARRWWFYSIAVLATIGLETAFLALRGLRDPIDVASLIVLPILALIVYVFVGTDATGQDVPPAARWTRVLERSWAVIVIDIVCTLLLSVAIGGLSVPNGSGLVIGLVAYALVMLTIFADINAALEPNVGSLWLIPGAFARSAVLATHRSNVFLTLSLVATDVLFYIIEGLLASWFSSIHFANALFWANIPLQALLQIPLGALGVVVYLECIAREKAAATGRR
jgi:hypothetical protein